MKRGFTLVELLGILVILGVIVLVSVPSLITTNKASKENEIAEFKATVENAAESYVETHPDSFTNLKNCTGTGAITTEKLVKEGFLDGSTVNPETNQKIINEASTVNITLNDCTLIYTYTN